MYWPIPFETKCILVEYILPTHYCMGVSLTETPLDREAHWTETPLDREPHWTDPHSNRDPVPWAETPTCEQNHR